MSFGENKKLTKQPHAKHTKERKHRFVAVIVISAFFLATIVLLGLYISDGFNEVSYVSLEPRDFELPIYINLNGTRSFDVDIEFKLDFTYNNGTLIVDEPISVKSTAVFLSKEAENVDTVLLGIQNCLAYNTTEDRIVHDYWGIPQSAFLFFNSSQSGFFYPYVWTEETTVIWTIDGAYHPIIALTFKNQTEPKIMLIEDVSITVYPREQVTQVKIAEANTRLTIVNTRLSIAVFIMSGFSLIPIIWQILPRDNKESEDNTEEQNELTTEKQEPNGQPQTDKQEDFPEEKPKASEKRYNEPE